MSIALCTRHIQDFWSWVHEKNGVFSVRSAYRMLVETKMRREAWLEGRLANSNIERESKLWDKLWKVEVPSKVKIFLWQAFRGRLPSADQIRKRNVPGSEFCALWGALEDMNHIFFHCVLAKLVWSCVRSWLQVTWNPSSFPELRNLAHSLVGVTKRVFWVGLGAIC